MYIVYMLVVELFEGYSGNLIIQASLFQLRPSSAPVYLIFEKPILRLIYTETNGIMGMPLVTLDSCHWSFFYIWPSYISAYVLLSYQINNGMVQGMQTRGLKICILHFCKALEQTVAIK